MKCLFLLFSCFVFFCCSSAGTVMRASARRSDLYVADLFSSEPEIISYSDSIPYMKKQLSVLQGQLSDLMLDVKKNVMPAQWNYRNISDAIERSGRVGGIVDSSRTVFDIYNIWVDSMNNIGHIPRNTLRNIKMPENIGARLAECVYAVYAPKN